VPVKADEIEALMREAQATASATRAV
jgi:hypothetical protein